MILLDGTHAFTKEYNVWLDEPAAFIAGRDFCLANMGPQLPVFVQCRTTLVVFPFTVDAVCACKTPMRFNNFCRRDAGEAFQSVDILRKNGMKFALLVEKDKKSVSRCRFEVAWGYGGSESVDCNASESHIAVADRNITRLWIVSKVMNVENGFRIRKIELREVGLRIPRM